VISYQYWTTTSAELSYLRPGGMSALAIWVYRIGNVALNSLNAFWFYKMLSGALKVLGGDFRCPSSRLLQPMSLRHENFLPDNVVLHTQVAIPIRLTSDDWRLRSVLMTVSVYQDVAEASRSKLSL